MTSPLHTKGELKMLRPQRSNHSVRQDLRQERPPSVRMKAILGTQVLVTLGAAVLAKDAAILVEVP